MILKLTKEQAGNLEFNLWVAQKTFTKNAEKEKVSYNEYLSENAELLKLIRDNYINENNENF